MVPGREAFLGGQVTALRDDARLPVLAVFGPGDAFPVLETLAERVGRAAGEHGWVVLTGGGPGVMSAACRGAVEAGGLTVGVLPVATPGGGYPNRWVRIAVFTGAGSARNAFNVLSADLCLALGGGAGTLSEIALALKEGRELWCFRSWGLAAPPGAARITLRRFDEAETLVAALHERLRSQ